MSTNSNAPAGWYPVDGGQRYWNGAQWTADFRPDPVPAAAAVTGSRQPHAFSSPEPAQPTKAARPGASRGTPAGAIGRPAATSQGNVAAVPGGPTGAPKTKAAWYKKGWVIGLAAL